MLPHSTVPSDLIEFKVPRIHSRRILRLPHKDISFLLRVRAFVVYPLSAGRSVTNSTPWCTDQSFNRQQKEQNTHLIDGLHVSRPQPLNTFLAVALFFFSQTALELCRARLRRQNIQKSYAALWARHSAPLILYNSAQRHHFVLRQQSQ